MNRPCMLAVAMAGSAFVTGCESSTGLESEEVTIQVAEVVAGSATVTLSNHGPNVLAVFPCNIERQRLEAGVWEHEAWLSGECDLAAIETIPPASSWSITVGWPGSAQGAIRVGVSVGPLEGVGPVQDRLERTFSEPLD